MRDFFRDQVVIESTRIKEATSYTFDHFFTTYHSLINKVEVILGISDHETIFTEASLKPLNVKIPMRKVFQYRKGINEGKRAILPFQTEFENQADTMDVVQLWPLFKNKICSLNNHVHPVQITTGKQDAKAIDIKGGKGSHVEKRFFFFYKKQP